MARVQTVEKSLKSPGNCGKCGKEILKGDPYRWWKFRYGGGKRIRCMTVACRPRQSDLTGSDKLSRAYAAGEAIEDAISDFRDDHDLEALKQAASDAAEELREVADEYRESAQNVEDGMNGNRMPICDELEEKADALESQADDIDSAVGDLDDREDEELTEEVVVKALEEEDGDLDTHVGELLREENEGYDDLPESEREGLAEKRREEIISAKTEEMKEDLSQELETWVDEVAGALEQYTVIEVG